MMANKLPDLFAETIYDALCKLQWDDDFDWVVVLYTTRFLEWPRKRKYARDIIECFKFLRRYGKKHYVILFTKALNEYFKFLTKWNIIICTIKQQTKIHNLQLATSSYESTSRFKCIIKKHEMEFYCFEKS